MSTDEDKQNPKDEALLNVLKRTEVDKDQVVSMVGGLVGMLGRLGGASNPLTMPQQSAQPSHPNRKEPQKNIKHIIEKLGEASNAKSVDCIKRDEDFVQWLGREGCKLKNFHDEMKFARQTIELAVECKDYELGLMAAVKAIKICELHARKDRELLSELYWVQAELFAMSNKMDMAKSSLKQCVKLVNPDATEESDAFRELAQQLEETRKKALSVSVESG